MAQTNKLLVLARLDPEQKRVLGVTATATKLELFVIETVEAALTWLDRNDPRLVVFDTALPKADKLCARVRSNKALALVPIIGIAAEINDALAPKLYAMGADDLIPPAFGPALMTRLRAMPTGTSLHPPPDRGKAVIADADKARADLFGRVLSNAGYDVKYALDDLALKFYAQQTDIKVVVANTEIGDQRALVQQARQAGSKAVWIVTAQRRDLDSFTSKLAGLELTRVMGLGAPPENILFTSNELLTAGTRPARASARLLWATTVLFREAGADLDELGSTYNVSAGGLYVRTLAPAPSVPVWLELRPPRSKQRVRLEGRVAWQRPFHQAAGATVPPGFGVELTAGLGEALAVWNEAYAALAQQEASGRRLPPVPPPPPRRTAAEPPSIRGAPQRDSTIEEVDEIEAELLATSEPPPKSAEAPPWPKEVPPIAPAANVPEIPPAPVAPIAPVVAARAPTAAVAPRRRSRIWLWLVLAIGVLVGGAAAVVSVQQSKKPQPVPSTPPAPPTVASIAPSASAPPVPVASVAATRDAAVTDAAADAAKQASAADTSAANETPASALLPSQGYLFVEAKGTFDVYATGVKIGPTNQKNVSRCGLRYVRLGEGDPVKLWHSAGYTVDVKCQDTTRVTIAVTP